MIYNEDEGDDTVAPAARPGGKPCRCAREGPAPAGVGEVLDRSDIEARFAPAWVLVGDPELDDRGEVARGTVLWHSRDPQEVFARARELRPDHAVFLQTGLVGQQVAADDGEIVL